MVLKKWKQRRQSVRELREQEQSVHAEYLKLKEREEQLRQPQSKQPPQYQEGMSSSGESVFGMGDGRPRIASLTGSQANSQESR